MWAVQVSYKGFDQHLDKEVEKIALEEGGTWTGQGFTTGTRDRSIVWESPTKREANNYVRGVKRGGKMKVTKPWKRGK